ncbi:MAG: DUF4231 domain-containing protein [Desulfobacteraceae bacterium]|nr:DUF4231 domain-containing protein [Desulfobacteraceae bacterium]
MEIIERATSKMEEDFLKNRLDDQIDWYSTKSQTNQKYFKRLRLLEIVAAALIPFLAGIGSSMPCYSVIIGALGVIIAVSAGSSALYKFHENWIEYRTTAETLKHEKYLYQTRCSPYDKDDAFCRLVQRVEGLISKENSQWSLSSEKE